MFTLVEGEGNERLGTLIGIKELLISIQKFGDTEDRV